MDVNTVVAEVMDLNRLAVSAEIPAAEASDLKSGEEFQVLSGPPVTTDTFVCQPGGGRNNDTVLTRALLPADSGLRPGQFVPLHIVTAVHTNCLAAPDESVVTDESGKSVIALVKGDEATQMPVQTGLRENGWVEIAGTGTQGGRHRRDRRRLRLAGENQNPRAEFRPATNRRRTNSPSSPRNEARHHFTSGPVRHAARAVHHVHRGGVVPGGNFSRAAHAVVGVSRRRISRASSSS